MIQSYHFQLSKPLPFTAAYALYAALLEQAPGDFATRVHDSAVTPVSQHVCADRWQVSLLGTEAIDALAPTLESLEELFLRRSQTRLELRLDQIRTVPSVEALLQTPPIRRGTLRFVTPTAFKSAGAYQLLPTQRLVMQNLILKWNGCFGELCPIEDEGGGLEALANGLRYDAVELHTHSYSMKHTQIPGILGSINFDNRLSDFHRQLAQALLTFGTYSGLGIKTALGMGGLQLTEK